jgi:hypothetical protein
MWGKDTSKQLRLMSSKLQDFQKAIPLDMLPKHLTEAIQITRYLGFKFLWIDSLCIIQDSESDWTAEASMMSAVYNNAVCTIAIVMPPDGSYDSSWRREDPRASTPCIIGEPFQVRRGIRGSRVMRAIAIEPFGVPQGTNLIHRGWPLSSRAWTLQEQVLSPRTVFWGDRTIKWECAEHFCDELAGNVGGIYRRSQRIHRISQVFASNKSLLSLRHVDELDGTSPKLSRMKRDEIHYEIHTNWIMLIREYRRRDLTQSSDRIMAFVGIAQAFQAEHGLTYLAGMWKEHLPHSLLWFIHDPANGSEATSPIPQEPVLESAPTWSFFAGSLYSSHLDRIIPFGHSFHWVSYMRRRPLSVAKLLHFTWPNAPVDTLPPTAYYDFLGLRITLEFITLDILLPRDEELEEDMLLCSIVEARLKSQLDSQLESLFQSGEKRLSEPVFVNFHFDDHRNLHRVPTIFRVALVEETFNATPEIYRFKGLVLGPAVEENTWKRLGYWEATARLAGLGLPLVSMTTAEETLSEGKGSTFLRLQGSKVETLTLV